MAASPCVGIHSGVPSPTVSMHTSHRYNRPGAEVQPGGCHGSLSLSPAHSESPSSVHDYAGPTVQKPEAGQRLSGGEVETSMQDIEKQPRGQPVTWLSLPHKPQLLILAMCRLSEPLSNTCLLPYLYYLLRSVESPASSSAETSRQAGLVVALFALAQFATSMPWARLADLWGRKTIIVIGLVVSIIANIGFGFARSIPALMCWRLLAGVANGNIGVMRTMTAEIVKEKKFQSRAFLLLPLVFNLGTVIGLALGGILADPVLSIPSLFGPQGTLNLSNDPQGVAWLRKYPFALPTIANAASLGVSLVLAVGSLKETLPRKAGHHDHRTDFLHKLLGLAKGVFRRNWKFGITAVETDKHHYSESHKIELQNLLDNERIEFADQLGPSTQPSPAQPTWNRDVLCTLLSFALLPLHNAAFMQVFPVFLSTPQSDNSGATPIFFDGGLGLPSSIIGLWLSAFGILGIMVQLLVYPRLQAYRGTLWAYRLALIMFPFAYIVAPYLSLCPTQGMLRWLGIFLILFIQVTARTFAIPSSVILLTNVAPSKKDLSMIHGAGNMVSSLSRAVGPAVAGWVFGWGIDIGAVGAVWWLYLTLIAGAGYLWSWRLREGEGPI